MKKKIIFMALVLAVFFYYISQHSLDLVPVDLAHRMAPMSSQHPLGTDPLGRDMLDLLLMGFVRTCLVIFIAGGISLSVGLLAGLLAGYYKGNIALVLHFITDFLLICPTFIVALLVTALFGLSPVSAGLSLGLCQMGHFANHSEEMTESILQREYIKILPILGYPNWLILLKHILPDVLPMALPFFGSMASSNILAYASLAFIGLGSDITKPDWGTMLYQYRVYMIESPQLILWPSLGIFFFALVFHLVFDTRRLEDQ